METADTSNDSSNHVDTVELTGEIRCSCRRKDNGYGSIECEMCKKWQHFECMKLDPNKSYADFYHICHICKKRQHGARIFERFIRYAEHNNERLNMQKWFEGLQFLDSNNRRLKVNVMRDRFAKEMRQFVCDPSNPIEKKVKYAFISKFDLPREIMEKFKEEHGTITLEGKRKRIASFTFNGVFFGSQPEQEVLGPSSEPLEIPECRNSVESKTGTSTSSNSVRTTPSPFSINFLLSMAANQFNKSKDANQTENDDRETPKDYPKSDSAVSFKDKSVNEGGTGVLESPQSSENIVKNASEEVLETNSTDRATNVFQSPQLGYSSQPPHEQLLQQITKQYAMGLTGLDVSSPSPSISSPQMNFVPGTTTPVLSQFNSATTRQFQMAMELLRTPQPQYIFNSPGNELLENLIRKNVLPPRGFDASSPSSATAFQTLNFVPGSRYWPQFAAPSIQLQAAHFVQPQLLTQNPYAQLLGTTPINPILVHHVNSMNRTNPNNEGTGQMPTTMKRKATDHLIDRDTVIKKQT